MSREQPAALATRHGHALLGLARGSSHVFLTCAAAPHTCAPQVNFKPGNIATIGGVDLELLQFHFHTPSEHALDGKRSPMEVHLVRAPPPRRNVLDALAA